MKIQILRTSFGRANCKYVLHESTTYALDIQKNRRYFQKNANDRLMDEPRSERTSFAKLSIINLVGEIDQVRNLHYSTLA